MISNVDPLLATSGTRLASTHRRRCTLAFSVQVNPSCLRLARSHRADADPIPHFCDMRGCDEGRRSNFRPDCETGELSWHYRCARGAGVLASAGGWAVAAQVLALVPVPGHGGAVGVADQGQAHPVDHDVMVIS